MTVNDVLSSPIRCGSNEEVLYEGDLLQCVCVCVQYLEEVLCARRLAAVCVGVCVCVPYLEEVLCAQRLAAQAAGGTRSVADRKLIRFRDDSDPLEATHHGVQTCACTQTNT